MLVDFGTQRMVRSAESVCVQREVAALGIEDVEVEVLLKSRKSWIDSS